MVKTSILFKDIRLELFIEVPKLFSLFPGLSLVLSSSVACLDAVMNLDMACTLKFKYMSVSLIKDETYIYIYIYIYKTKKKKLKSLL